MNDDMYNRIVEILRKNKPELKVRAVHKEDLLYEDLKIDRLEFNSIENDIEMEFNIDCFCCDNIENYAVYSLVYEVEDHLTDKKDYGSRVLRQLIKEIKSKSLGELEKEAREADIEYLKIVDKRGGETEIKLDGTGVRISTSIDGWKLTKKS